MQTIILKAISSDNANFRNRLKHTRSPRLWIVTALLVNCLTLCPQVQSATDTPDPGALSVSNTADGQGTLQGLTSGLYNSAFGFLALLSNADANFNTGIGAGVLLLNNASENTAVGAGALLSNTLGTANTANGAFALFNNIGGSANSDNPGGVLLGSFNTAVGNRALFSNTSGHDNVAIGASVLFTNIEGIANTAVGSSALQFSTGSSNTALGDHALFNSTIGTDNTGIGAAALVFSTGNGNTALGAGAGGNVTTANNVICIRAPGEDVNNSCFIGNIYTNAQPIVGTDPDSVTITSSGRLGRGNVSSRRYKHDIHPMERDSEALHALKPVSFRYNKEYDASQTLAFGLIAEEVAEVYPNLVGRNREGQPESVRYEQINAMLLNEFLKEHKAFVEEQHKVEKLEAAVANLVATVKEQAAQIQKVSMRLEVSNPAARIVSHGQ